MAGVGINIGRSTLDDFFKTDEGRKTEEIKPIKLEELKPFADTQEDLDYINSKFD